jgi:U3 small nucleolar RNA-associated protein 20
MRSTYAVLPKLSILTSLRSVSQTLQSAGSLITSLIDCHLTSDTADLSYTLLRRVLTALVHHYNGSEQFSVVANLVVDRFCTLSQAKDMNYQQLQRAMQITSVVCSVRQGSRLFCTRLSVLSRVIQPSYYNHDFVMSQECAQRTLESW